MMPAKSPLAVEALRYQRRILLAVTGLSPQIVTETLWALAVEHAWVPTRIRIITTQRGAQEARRTLLSADPGWFSRLCADYRLPEIEFGPDDIQIITGPHGEPLDDILTEMDNAAVADFITEQVRSLTADAGNSLHVSIAGGRKTMGFYVGYALSLFGREQDRLSHVLVSPPFESQAEFFYPAPHPRPICDGTLDAQNAHVHLGEIPIVRLRDELPERVLKGRARFSEAVAAAQKALPPLALHLDPATRAVTAGGECFVLKPALFAFYWMMCERCRAGRGGAHWGEAGLGDELLDCYRQLVNVYSASYEHAEQAYRNFKKDNFDPAKAHLNAALQRHLGERRAAPYLIGKLDPIYGTRYHRFGLALPGAAITIAAATPTSLPAQQQVPEAGANRRSTNTAPRAVRAP
jgi:CRISPR-associated protein (TIGR02584 family)